MILTALSDLRLTLSGRFGFQGKVIVKCPYQIVVGFLDFWPDRYAGLGLTFLLAGHRDANLSPRKVWSRLHCAMLP